MDGPISVETATQILKGFESIEIVHGATYKDCSSVLIVPTRGKPWEPSLSARFFDALSRLIAPMNQARVLSFACGHEVGQAYNATIEVILASTVYSSAKYILTVEDDNFPPPDGHLRLLESIDETGFDAMAGLYFTKGLINEPMAYGDPEGYRRTGVLDFRPRDVREAVAKRQVMEVNGVAMGFTLWRTELFKEIPGPWFVTCPEIAPGEQRLAMTQDLSFCAKARRAGKRFGVDCRVKVAHWDAVNEAAF